MTEFAVHINLIKCFRLNRHLSARLGSWHVSEDIEESLRPRHQCHLRRHPEPSDLLRLGGSR